MKTLIIVLLVVLAINSKVDAQAPQGFNFQGIALDSTGNVVTSKLVSLRFSISTDSLGNSVSYRESTSSQTDKYGQFTTVIGSGVPSIGRFNSIIWSSGNLYMKTEIDISNTGKYVVTGLSRLLSVPYALQANSSSNINSDSLHNTRAGSNSLYKNTTGKINTAIGDSSLYSTTTGYSNTATGAQSLYSNTTGFSNTANGVKTLQNNTTGYVNTATGQESLYSNTTGNHNTANGFSSLKKNTTGIANTAMGAAALLENTTGSLNTATGTSSLFSNTTGYNNTAIGNGALLKNTTGGNNTANGVQSLDRNTTGTNNTAIGYNSGRKLTTGDKNIFIGNDAGNNINFTTTSNKLVIQNDSSKTPLIYGEFDNKKITINGDLEVTGALKGSFSKVFKNGNGTNITDTMFLADDVDFYETGDGFWNLVVSLPLPNSSNSYLVKRLNTSLLLNCRSTYSFKILQANTDLKDELTLRTGEYAIFTYAYNRWILTGKSGGLADISSDTLGNTRTGTHSLEKNTTGSGNTANGENALLSNTTGIRNTASGKESLYSNTTGFNNTASGINSLFSNTTGYGNTASGYYALGSNTTGFNNTASGINSLLQNSTGYNNTASGITSLLHNRTGGNNTASGYKALYYNTTGNYNTAIGVNSLPDNTTGSFNTAIGNNAGNFLFTGSNNTFIGNGASASSDAVSNEITIGNSSIATLRAQVTSITALSDRRDKTDIISISEGLDFIKQLKPVSFTWNTRDKAKVGIKSAGFIAQDLLALQQQSKIGSNLDLVSQENPEKLEARYNNLLPVIVKAIQEESAEKDRKIADLEARLKSLEAIVNKR